MWDDGDTIHAQLVLQQAQDEQRLEAVLEEAFEVQTYQPFHGWVYDRFCDRSGNTYPALSEAAADIHDDAKLNALKEQDVENMEIGVLPSSEWMWSHPWLPDLEYTHCDEDGWTYGSTIARINRRLAEGTSKVKREYYHFVRRRRWIRMRVKKPSVPEAANGGDATIPAARERNGSSDELFFTDTSSASTPHRYYREYNDSLFAHFRLSTPSSALSHFTVVRFSDENVLREGWLGQRGTFSRSWKLRYFILRRDTSCLVCLRDRASLVAVSVIPIDRHTSTTPETSPNPNQFQFLVINGQHRIRLNAVDGTSRQKWLVALNELIVRKRASFLAAEDSDSVHNGQSLGRSASFRFLRRMRSSRASDEGSSSWVPPAFSKMPSDSYSDVSEQTRKKKPIWRPYKLVASTMHCKLDVDNETRRTYLVEFEEEFSDLLRVAKEFLETNIDILEDNLRIAEHVLTSAVVRVPQDDLMKLREEVTSSINAMAERLEKLVRTGRANVLQCNILRKALFIEVQRLTNTTMSFAPPVGQATVKKVAPDSPSKRRIPTDWFMGPVVIDNADKPENIPPADDRSVVAKTYDLSSSDSASSVNLISARRTRLSMDSGVNSFLHPTAVTSLTTTFAGNSDPVQIKTFRPIPDALADGHMELPDGVNGYVFMVHEHDLGSLISFALCSQGYVVALQSHFANLLDLASELRAEELTLGTKQAARHRRESISSSMELMYLEKLRYTAGAQHTEVKFAFDSGSTKHEFRCVAFFAAEFHSLRALSGHGNVDFLCSLARSKQWEASGGKSGAFFSMTHDKRYVMKGIPVNEFNMFLHMAPHYFKFMSKLMKTDTPTVITKILGLFKVTCQKRLHKHAVYIVVMENITYGFPPGQTYDIKGITRRRYTGPGNEESVEGELPRRMIHNLPVLLDGNLMERIPIPVRKADLDVVEMAFQNDTGFLCRAGVIDYSLIMVFDEERRQVVVGVIDYLHQFDLLKKMESTSKASLTFRNPTIISPPSYRTRFVNAMHRYLVGIELELELRICQRAGDSKGKRSQKMIASDEPPSAASVTDRRNAEPHETKKCPLTMSMVPKVRVKRAFSDGPYTERAPSFDRRADQAHSDGESAGSESSDEACLRESPAMISALMPEDDNHR